MSMPTHRGSILLALAFSAIFAEGAFAQVPEPEPDVPEFWFSRERMRAGAAAGIVGLGPQTPLVLAHRLMGRNYLVWDEIDVPGDVAPPLNPEWLALIKDGNAMPRLPGRLKEEIGKDEWATYNLYGQALVFAFQTPAEAFAKSAEENKDLFFSHLWNKPQLHRGKVVTVKGRLVRLEKVDATLNARKEGVQHLYEGWVFGPIKGATPYCIQFVSLPSGLQPAEKLNQDVVFHGYFLKKVKYRGSDAKDHVSPLLIGPTVILPSGPPAVEADTPFPIVALVSGAGLVGVVTVVLLWLNGWFRRGDDRVRARLLDIQGKSTLEAMEEAERQLASAPAVETKKPV